MIIDKEIINRILLQLNVPDFLTAIPMIQNEKYEGVKIGNRTFHSFWYPGTRQVFKIVYK